MPCRMLQKSLLYSTRKKQLYLHKYQFSRNKQLSAIRDVLVCKNNSSPPPSIVVLSISAPLSTTALPFLKAARGKFNIKATEYR